MGDVFISYSRKDGEFVRRLQEDLKQHKRDIWIDWRDIPPTTEWKKEIFANIEAADNFLFVVSPDSCASEICREEVAYAEACHKRLIPAVCREVKNKELPPALARIQWIAFTNGTFESSFQSLIQALDTDLEWVRSHTRLLVRARDWDLAGRDSAFLMRGVELQDSIRWLGQASAIRDPTLAAIQQEYIRASQQGEAQELEAAQQRERLATARERAAYAALNLTDDPELSVLLALHAAKVTWSDNRKLMPEVEAIMHRAILASRVRLTLSAHEGSDSVDWKWARLRLYGNQGATSVAWSADGSRVATGGADNRARIWDTATGKEVMSLEGHQSYTTCIAWSPDGKRVVTASVDSTAKIWDPVTGRLLVDLRGHKDQVNSALWSPDGLRVATGSYDSTLKLWEAETGREVLTIKRPTGLHGVHSLSWSPDGMLLATASQHDTVRVWEASTGKLRGELPSTPDLRLFSCVAWSPDGKLLAIGNRVGTQVWNAALDSQVLNLKMPHTSAVFCLAWRLDSKALATGSMDCVARIWDVLSGQESLTLRGHTGSVNGIAWSPEGLGLATASSDGTVRVWEAVPGAAGRELWTLHIPNPEGSVTLHAAWSQDWRRIATACFDGSAQAWDTDTGRHLLNFGKNGFFIEAVAWSPDGTQLAAGFTDGTVQVHHAATARVLADLAGERFDRVLSLTWSPDGEFLATTTEGSVTRIWNVATGQELMTLKGGLNIDILKDRTAIVWSPDGRWLALAGVDGTGRILDAGTGQEILSLSSYPAADVDSLACSPDGNTLAGASGQAVLLWDTATGRLVSTLSKQETPGRNIRLRVVAWSPDGKRLAAGDQSGATHVWNLSTGELLNIVAHKDQVVGVSWSPDGKRLASAGWDNFVQEYPIDGELLMKLARSRVTRNLRIDESRRYLHADEVPPIPFSDEP